MMTARAVRTDDVEEATQALGESVLSHITSAPSERSEAEWWEERILEWAMSHADLKVELFRFIDVLPTLRPRAVTPHLMEYLGHARGDLPALLRWGADVTPTHGAVARVVASAARRNVSRMARRFIAGATPGEAVAAIRGLRRQRLAVTLDVLGEAVITEEEADSYATQYVDLLRGASRLVGRLPEDPLIDRDYDGAPLPRINVSLKLSALTALFDPIDPEGTKRAVIPRLCRVLDVAREVGGFVHVDMEHHEFKDLTLEIFREVLGQPPYDELPNVGIVLQAYLRDAERDLAELARFAAIRKAPVWVRLVKGAYWDYETVIAAQRGWPVPVWTEKWQSDACYERCTDLLLENARALRPAFGSHNVRSLCHAIAAARALGLPERFLEIQTLYGMADSVKHALVNLEQRVRVYTPYGELIPGMAYLVRRLLENTSNESFVRHQVAVGENTQELMARPAPAPRARRAEVVKMITSPEPSTFENEPLLDFSREAVRKHFSQAIGDVGNRLGIACPLVIGGAEEMTDDPVTIRCPSDTRLVVARAASATMEHADRAVRAAREAWPMWRDTPAFERAAILDRAAAILGDRRTELAAWVSYEAGKPWRDADADIAEAMDFCRYYASVMRALAEPQRVRVPGEDDVTVYQPRGVAVAISPWNFPIAILCGMTAAALVTGSPTIMKPAEQTPASAYHLYRVFRDAGIPAGALQYLPGPGEIAGARLVEHPDVATIAFTGSRAVGHLIARRAAETSTGPAGIKRVIAEMGGKNAIIVDDDADLDEAVPGVLASAFGYAGQKCSACSRVIVLRGVYEAFLARLATAARSIVVGAGHDRATLMGPLIDDESVERVRTYVAEAEKTGRLVYRGELGPQHAHGRYAAPVIAAELPPGSKVLREEIFGPVLAVVPAATFDDALAIANATEYALTGGVYSRSPTHIEEARRRFDVGNLYINRKITGAFVYRQPFGGYRHSGTGSKAGGPDFLLQFLVARTICENTLRRGFAPE